MQLDRTSSLTRTAHALPRPPPFGLLALACPALPQAVDLGPNPPAHPDRLQGQPDDAEADVRGRRRDGALPRGLHDLCATVAELRTEIPIAMRLPCGGDTRTLPTMFDKPSPCRCPPDPLAPRYVAQRGHPWGGPTVGGGGGARCTPGGCGCYSTGRSLALSPPPRVHHVTHRKRLIRGNSQ